MVQKLKIAKKIQILQKSGNFSEKFQNSKKLRAEN